MTVDEAKAYLERQAVIKAELAKAPRYGAGAKAAGIKHATDVEAIRIILAHVAELEEGR